MKRNEAMIQAALTLVREHIPLVPQHFAYREGMRSVHSRIGVGRVERNTVSFDDRDVSIIDGWLTDVGIDPDVWHVRNDDEQTRIEVAAMQADEKIGATPISYSHSLAAVCAAGAGTATFDGIPVARGHAGFQVIRRGRLPVVEADWVMLVENYESFLSLCLDDSALSDSHAGRGLLVLRSSPQFPAGLRVAGALTENTRATLRHAPDMDLAGLSHVLDSRATWAWLPDLTVLTGTRITPNSKLYTDQLGGQERLGERLQGLFPALLPWFDWIHDARGGITQERLIAHDVPMVMVSQ
jgi:hypothetical protein